MKEWGYSNREMGILASKVSDALGGWKKSKYYVNTPRGGGFEIVRKSDRKAAMFTTNELLVVDEDKRPFDLVDNVADVIASKF